jgi:hypothetical protein
VKLVLRTADHGDRVATAADSRLLHDGQRRTTNGDRGDRGRDSPPRNTNPAPCGLPNRRNDIVDVDRLPRAGKRAMRLADRAKLTREFGIRCNRALNSRALLIREAAMHEVRQTILHVASIPVVDVTTH